MLIYADNAATTKISDSVLEKMLPFLNEQYGNASSQYSLGAKAKRAVEQARQQVADAIGAQPPEISFTSGGSESNSWVLRCVADAHRNESIHFITSAIEHHSVLNACHALEQRGVEITYLPVDISGRVSVTDVTAAIRPSTRLVSVMLANNEIGMLQPIAEIGRLLSKKDILFHTDAVQAVGHIPVDVNTLQVDFLTASAHKCNGPKGTGILFKRAEISLPPLIFGGEQELGLRAGTENVAGIVACGHAIMESKRDMDEASQRLEKMTQETVDIIRKRIPSVHINGGMAGRLPGVLNLRLDGVSGEAMMHLLDLKGICVSTSSACNSGNHEPSHVLLALGQSEEQAKCAIRISYGKFNQNEDAAAVAAAICDAYCKIKGIGTV